MRKKIFISVIAVSIFIIALLAIINSKNDGMENTIKHIQIMVGVNGQRME